MALIRCPECNKRISNTAASCPKCGYLLTREEAERIKQKQSKVEHTLARLVMVAIVVAIVFIEYRVNYDKSSGPARSDNKKVSQQNPNTAGVMNREFKSMSECLEGIQNSSKCSLKIVTDKPTEVSGLLSNGQGFACQIKTTGTKGTYFDGWYFVK